MYFAAWFLLFLALFLAWPVPLLLSRSVWTVKAPTLALFVWQCVGITGGLSMIGAFLVYELLPLGTYNNEHLSVFSSMRHLIKMLFITGQVEQLSSILGFWHILALAVSVLLFCHLVSHLILVYYKMSKKLKEHSQLLSLLATRKTVDEDSSAFVIKDQTPLAYLLPLGLLDTNSSPVITQGLIDKLGTQQLQAVIAHEKAHLEKRHDLLQWAFASWKSALPWLPTAEKAWINVINLIELVADDKALESIPKHDMRNVLHYLTNTETSESRSKSLDTDSLISYRILRLSDDYTGPGSSTRVSLLNKSFIAISAISLLIIPILILSLPS